MRPFTQTPAWAQINQHHNQMTPRVFEAAEISCLFGEKDGAWTSFQGPLIPESSAPSHLLEFLNTVLLAAKSARISEIHFRALAPLRHWGGEFEEIFKDLGFKHHAWKTLIVDLSVGQEPLLRSFDHAARKGIKKAQSSGIVVARCENFEAYFRDFLVPYYQTTHRSLKEKTFYQKGWDFDQENIYTYWTAREASGELLGFLGTYRYEGVATEIMSALTPRAFEAKVPVQDILHWEIMQHHQQAGDRYFDLAGFNPQPSSPKEENIKRFKEKWGGRVYDTSSYALDRRSFSQKILLKIWRKIHG